MEATMKKLKLEIDTLEVESFDADGALARKGTVHGHVTYQPNCATDPPNCNTSPFLTCGDWLTCAFITCDTRTGFEESECGGSCNHTACFDGNTCTC
jgi:hypothetical protein